MKILILISIFLLVIVILLLISIFGLISKNPSANELGNVGSFIKDMAGPILLIANMALVWYLGTHVNEFLTKRTYDYNKMIKMDELKYSAYSSFCNVVDPIIFYNATNIRTTNIELIKNAISYIDRFWGNYDFLFRDIQDQGPAPTLLKLCVKTSNSLTEMYNAKINWDKSPKEEFEEKFTSSSINFANQANAIKVTLQFKIFYQNFGTTK